MPRCLAMQVLEGLGSLRIPGAEGFPSLQTHVLSETSDQLAVKAVHSSTQDRDEEDKKHVLVRSKCGTGLESDQSDCSCKDGALPCYWSSCPRTEQASDEFITLRLKSTVCLIHSITLQPYQAWWQVPLNVKPPVYAPREVFVEFGALDEEDLDAQGQPILQDKWLVSAASARRDVPHSSNNATADQALKGLDLVFDKPLLVVGGYCKVHLCGKVQKQPVLGQEEWYCCIAYCGVRGAALRSVHSRLASRGSLNQVADLALDDAAGRRVGVDREACARAGVGGAGKGARSAESGGGLSVNVAGSMVLAQ